MKVGDVYRYKEICEIRGEKCRTGKSKQLQLKDWKRFFNWEQIGRGRYCITEIYDSPKEKIDHRGGARSGAGAKRKLDYEIKYLINAVLYTQLRKNGYYGIYGWSNVFYINNDEFAKAFGIYNNLYAAREDTDISQEVFMAVANKLREKYRSLVLDRLAVTDGVTLSYGLLAIKQKKELYHVKDEWLELWLKLQQDYFSMKGFRSERDVILRQCWDDMNNYITHQLVEIKKENFELIKKYRKITFDPDKLVPYDYEMMVKCQKAVNVKVIKEVYAFFLEKEKKAAIKKAEDEKLLRILSQDEANSETSEQEVDIETLITMLDNLDNYEETEPIVEFNEKEQMAQYRKMLSNYILLK